MRSICHLLLTTDKKRKMRKILNVMMKAFLMLAAVVICSCAGSNKESFSIKYEKYVLANGLEVVLHEDHSDPIVAVATLMHVGSSREKPGKTGFAHFFEHMSFNDSENVPRGANRKYIPELGGERNGGTWSDGTIFYEVVPKDAFEKIMWIDSDRLGYMINTVTEAALEREKQVVKNEKRQNVDNRAYGKTSEVIKANLYPEGHPYSWTVIGSLPDLQGATVDDVKEFYNKYYGASNATLVIAGDINIEETKKMVEKWFGEIRSGEKIEDPKVQRVSLTETKELYYEDNFAKLPELRMVFPTVEQYSKDGYALSVLGDILSSSKKAPFYKVIVEEKKLAPNVYTYHHGEEIAGTFTINIRANAGVDLDDVKLAVEESFSKFEADGFDDSDLKRIKAKQETALYYGIQTVQNKSHQLARYNEFAGDPGYITKVAKDMQGVTREDIMRVYKKYIKGKHYVMTNFVPKGQLALAVEGAKEAKVYEEPITASAKHEEVSQGEEAKYEKTASKYDRSEPALGKTPLVKTPEVWKSELAQGVKVLGMENSEVPLVTFDLTFKGGHWLDPMDKSGVASLLTDLMMEGTATKTPVELEDAIGQLGAYISMGSSAEEIRVYGNVMARNFEATLDLIEEIIKEPRWDEKEYERLLRELNTRLKGQEANPNAIARKAFGKLLYGEDHILGMPSGGTPETVANITMDDLKAYYKKCFTPALASFHIVGDVSKDRAVKGFNNFVSDWKGESTEFPKYELPKKDVAGKVYFVDYPGAKQSIIMAGRLALSGLDDDHNNLNYANKVLGGGASGRLFQLLRIEKGYTYGAYSYIGSNLEKSPFTAYTSVRSNVTLESLNLMRDQFDNYAATFGEEEMEVTKNMEIKSKTRAYESLFSKLNILQKMDKFDSPSNYIDLNQKELMDMKLADFHSVINKYIVEDDLFYLVIGDAKTQVPNVEKFGLGKPVMLDTYGRITK